MLRQKWVVGLRHREVARSLGLGLGTVCRVLQRAQAAGLDWARVEVLGEEVPERRVYGEGEAAARVDRPMPDCGWIHTERSKPGVTVALLHVEYLAQHPGGHRYTQFCERYRRWLGRRGLTMRQVHRAGEKCFVDYAGQKPTTLADSICDRLLHNAHRIVLKGPSRRKEATLEG